MHRDWSGLLHTRTLDGQVKAVDYRGRLSPFCILQVESDAADGAFRVFGKADPIATGDYVEATGIWHEINGEMVFNAFEIKRKGFNCRT